MFINIFVMKRMHTGWSMRIKGSSIAEHGFVTAGGALGINEGAVPRYQPGVMAGIKLKILER